MTQRSLAVFGCFLGGYEAAALDVGRSVDFGWTDSEFVRWLEGELHIGSLGTHDSFAVVSLAFADDHDALDSYVILLDRFLESRTYSVAGSERERWDKGGSVPRVLSQLRKTPRMYIRSNSLAHLRGWLDGFAYAHQDNGVVLEGAPDLIQLYDHIRRREGVLPTCEWHRAILLNYSDDGPALSRFFELCDESNFLVCAESAASQVGPAAT